MNEPPRRRRRRWIVAAVAAALVVVVAGGVWSYLHPGTSPVPVRDAIDRFRKDDAGSPIAEAEAAERLPEPGVYVYATTGFERLDALGGSRHAYPAQTTMTVERNGCGIRERWAPLEQRWQEYQRCWRGGGQALLADTGHHEFFRQSATRTFACEDGVWLLPPEADIGSTWTKRCHNADGIDTTRRGRVVGSPTIRVGGKDVRTIHVRYDDIITGASEGTAALDWWVDQRTGLTVRIVQRVDTRNDSPIGRVGFHDEYRLALTSTTPQR